MRIILLCLFATFTLATSAQFTEEKDKPALGHKFVYAEQAGKSYVPFIITTLDGKVIDNSNSRGKVTFINFWFMGCPGCVAEFGELNKLYTRYAKNKSFQFVGVTYDDPKDLPAFIAKHNIKYPVACVSKEESKRMYAHGYPTNLIIDKQGNTAYLCMGKINTIKKNSLHSVSEDSIITLVNRLLKE